MIIRFCSQKQYLKFKVADWLNEINLFHFHDFHLHCIYIEFNTTPLSSHQVILHTRFYRYHATLKYTHVVSAWMVRTESRIKKEILTITFPTSRIDAAIPEKLNPKEAEWEKRSSESRDTLGEVLANAGMCFEGRGARPLITGSGLFEELLRGNKNSELEERGRRLVERKRTSHLPNTLQEDGLFFSFFWKM